MNSGIERCVKWSWLLQKPPPHVIGVNHPNLGVNHPNLGVNHPDLGVNRPNLGVNHPDLGVNHPDLGVNCPDLGVNHPDLGKTSSALHADILPLHLCFDPLLKSTGLATAFIAWLKYSKVMNNSYFNKLNN